jgi:hypothetical protein
MPKCCAAKCQVTNTKSIVASAITRSTRVSGNAWSAGSMIAKHTAVIAIGTTTKRTRFGAHERVVRRRRVGEPRRAEPVGQPEQRGKAKTSTPNGLSSRSP